MGLWITPSDSLAAEKLVNLKLSVNISNDELGHPTAINSEAVMDLGDVREICFYLPFNDPDYGFDRENNSKFSAGKSIERRSFKGGSTKFVEQPKNVRVIFETPLLVRVSSLDSNSGLETLRFEVESKLPRLHSAQYDDFVYRGFYPQPLRNCPDSKVSSRKFQRLPKLEIEANIVAPPKLTLSLTQDPNSGIGNGKKAFTVKPALRRELVFVGSNSFQVRHFKVSGIPIHLYFKSDDFIDLIPTIKSAFVTHEKWMGPYPFPSMTVVETGEVQASGLPSIVTVNRPRQITFSNIQNKILNWRHWVLATQMAAQWMLASMTTASEDDKWFVQGVMDFAVLKALKKLSGTFDLFSTEGIGFDAATLTYRQIQDIGGTALSQSDPFSVLTTETFESAKPFERQNPFLYLRQAIALRQIESVFGPDIISQLLRGFVQESLSKEIRPVDFLNYISEESNQLTADQRTKIASYLKQWWHLSDWPEMALEEIKSRRTDDGKWSTTITAIQNSEIDLPAKVKLVDAKENVYWAELKKSPNQVDLYQTDITSEYPYDEVMIDPDREVYDSDRFNNTNKMPALKFFPGTTNTMLDDEYTIFWLPYFFRRPGESSSIGIQAALFRYLSSGLYFRFEYAVSDKLGAFVVTHKNNIPKYALNTNTSMEQSYDGGRVTQVAVERKPLFNFGPKISLTAKASMRQAVGIPDSKHGTLSWGFKIEPASFFGFCTYKFAGESEHTNKNISPNFQYVRRTLYLAGGCNFRWNIGLGMRLFRGTLLTSDEVSETLFFRINDVKGAKIRIDDPDIPVARTISAGTISTLFPLYLPFPGNSMILSRKLRLQLFYDFGIAGEPKPNRTFRAAGAGIVLPFGGDLVGGGPLTVANVSFTSILYSNSNGTINRKPSYLFGLSYGF